MKSNSDTSDELAVIRRIDARPARLFAFGDIHGCNAELNLMLEHLASEHSASADDHYIFMGDYIDRGPDSKGVIDTLINWSHSYPNSVFLRGNHEDMLLDFIGMGGSAGSVYLGNGGAEFFKSYGINPDGPLAEVAKSLPREHLKFFTSLEHGVTLGEFLFVHAGIDPALTLDQQKAHNIMWIRAQFIPRHHDLQKTVVFGHTPFADVYVHMPYKIGIDTGLVYGNMLSVVELVDGTVFQLDAGGDKVKVSSMRDRLNSGSD